MKQSGPVTTTQNPTRVPVSGPTLDPALLDRFRAVQRLAYDAAEEVASGLRAGVTERQAAARLQALLRQRGVDDWFHRPFAWFGSRTAFQGFRLPHQFLPTGRRLEPGDPFILDVAPVVRGATADIGFTGSLGPNSGVDRILDDLAAHRDLIVESVRAGWSLRRVYEAVDQLAARQGYANRHHAYPGHVLAHEVRPLSPRSGQGTSFRFGRRHLRSLACSIVAGHREGWSPLWSGDRRSEHPPVPGLWAVEPHLGLRGVGAKFEELLVVTPDDAYWLDDDLPHVRRWTERSITETGSR